MTQLELPSRTAAVTIAPSLHCTSRVLDKTTPQYVLGADNTGTSPLLFGFHSTRTKLEAPLEGHRNTAVEQHTSRCGSCES